MSCAVSRKNPGAGRAPLDPTGAPRGDHEPRREQKDERRGQQQLPGDRKDLVDADPHEGQRTHVTTRKTSSAFPRNQSGPSHAGPGPSQPPRKSSAPRKLVPSMWAYSPSWISANFIPLYSTRKPATSSDSASRMSKGTRFSAASVATR